MKKMIPVQYIALLMLGILLAGCQATEIVNRDDAFYLYFLDNEGVSLKTRTTTLAGEGTDEQIKEIINKLSDPEAAGDYVVAIPAGITVSEYELADGILSLHFNEEYKGLPPASEIMLRACVVKTLMQLPDVNAVSFYVGNKPLVDAAGKEPGSQNDETFLTSFGEETDDIESRVFELYYASEKGDSLVRIDRRIHYNSNTALENLVLEHLAEDPKKKGARAAIADGVHVLDVSVSDGICYVDLDGNFLSQTTGISTQVSIYAIVDSLCELPGIDKVQLLIDSESDAVVDTGTVSGLYEPDYYLVKKK